MTFLPIAFSATALLYACVGFGGGSTYNALLVLAGTDYRIIPLISLLCNIVVVSGGVWHFGRKGYIKISRVLPWILFSTPASFLGGMIPLQEHVFTGLLGLALLLSGIRMLWPEKRDFSALGASSSLSESKFIPPVVGTVLGLLAGLTGIGGGIFLAPVLHFLNWGNAKLIAGLCSLFIFVNSMGGLVGQALKLDSMESFSLIQPYWILFPAVLLGGQIGAWLGSARMNASLVKKITALVILYVAIRLLFRFTGLM